MVTLPKPCTEQHCDEVDTLRAQVEELTAILDSHRRQYADGRLPTWSCEATDEEIIEILLPASQSELVALRAENEQLEEQLTAAERSAREMHIVADNFLRERDDLRAELVKADRKLREYRPNVDDALAENERLRAALLKIADDSAHADQYVRWAQEALDA